MSCCQCMVMGPMRLARGGEQPTCGVSPRGACMNASRGSMACRYLCRIVTCAMPAGRARCTAMLHFILDLQLGDRVRRLAALGHALLFACARPVGCRRRRANPVMCAQPGSRLFMLSACGSRNSYCDLFSASDGQCSDGHGISNETASAWTSLPLDGGAEL